MSTSSKVSLLVFAGMLATCLALPAMRRAPQQCPVRSGNLVDPVLFVENATSCQELCSRNERCLYYFYYPGQGNSGSINAVDQPSQCFLYDECIRNVLPATENCPIKRENTVAVDAFVRDNAMCEKSCSSNAMCSYYQYFDKDDEKQPEMCYHLKSCSKRVIRDRECPLEPNNYIDHLMFVKGTEECTEKCEDNTECRFYHWYPIDYSPAPLYCYLFRSCEGGADEPHVALVASGRHPGHYFLDQAESLDIVRTEATCEKQVSPEGTAVGRAGAVSEFAQRRVLLCGGRDLQGEVRSDCLAYDPLTNEWEAHNNLLSAREEAASAVLRPEAGADGDMFLLGGFIDGQRTTSVDRLPRDRDAGWTAEEELPEPRSRFCAVAVGADTVAVIGGETGNVGEEGEQMATSDMKTFNVGDGGDGWVTQPGMAQPRKDHACLMVEIDGDRGILVTGGVDADDNLLDSVEFYSFSSETWQPLRSLKKPRTEHGMAYISGMAAVMGGVSSDEFLKSIEFLDNSAEDDAELGMDWRIAAHDLTRPRYDFTVAAVPISALPMDERKMNMCYDLAEIEENDAEFV